LEEREVEKIELRDNLKDFYASYSKEEKQKGSNKENVKKKIEQDEIGQRDTGLELSMRRTDSIAALTLYCDICIRFFTSRISSLVGRGISKNRSLLIWLYFSFRSSSLYGSLDAVRKQILIPESFLLS
jgi:hypothetical protein